jgi:hypothetical protein
MWGVNVLCRILVAAMLVAPVLSAAAEQAPAGKQAPALKLPSQGMTPDSAAQIPEARKLQIADQNLKAIRKAVDRVAARADEARTEKDVGKLNCLNAQLTQMKGLGKVASQANEAMVDALAKKDQATANTQFARIVIATDKVVKSGAEADVCLGQLAYLVDGQTQVEVEIPGGLPNQDVTNRAPPPAATITPPVVRPRPASEYY